MTAEADGNRTRLRRMPPHTGVEDRGDHQVPRRLPVPRLGRGQCHGSRPEPTYGDQMTSEVRLTQYAAGGGCACKLAPGVLDELLGGLRGQSRRHPGLLVGLDDGDDAAVVRLPRGVWGAHPDGAEPAIISTTDFFTPVVDRAFEWGQIAAANALSDVYAMGGRPLVALNLVGWPVDLLPLDLLAETLRGGAEVAAAASCPLGGGHSITAAEPLYGLAVTGVVDPGALLRNDAARAGLPLSLTKPLGLGVLNNRHMSTGAWFPEAVQVMTTLNAAASRAALDSGIRAATDVTGFGLLGHLLTLCRASGVGAVVDHAAVPYVEGARASLAAGFVPGGSRRNLEWTRPHLAVGPGVSEDELLLLADAQTSGGLLLVGEIPGAPVIGHLVCRDGPLISVR